MLRALQLAADAQQSPATSNDQRLLELIGRLEELPISRESLQKTGIGRAVNDPFLRRHANPAVRGRSCALVCGWKAQIGVSASPAGDAQGAKRSRPECSEASSEAGGPSSSCSSGSPGHSGAEGSAGSAKGGATGAGARGLGAAEAEAEDEAAAPLSQWPVQRLRARLRELGLSAVGCTEKGDLVALIQGASAAPSTPPAGAAGARPRGARAARRSVGPGMAAGRLSLGRQSLLRRRRSAARAPREAEEPRLARLARQRAELQRVLRAGSLLEVLGLQQATGAAAAPRARRRAVLQKYHELSRLVHPDKCPPELRAAATRAFQRLEEAKELGLLAGQASATAPRSAKRKAQAPAAPRPRSAWGGR